MLDTLSRLLAETGPTASWIVIFSAAAVTVFVLYVGIAMYATLRAQDSQQRKIRYRIFRYLLEPFICGRRR